MEFSVSVQSKSLLYRWKKIFHQVVFTIKSDVKPWCRPNVLTLFNVHLKNKTKLIKENSVPPCWAGPLSRVHIENFHLA